MYIVYMDKDQYNVNIVRVNQYTIYIFVSH